MSNIKIVNDQGEEVVEEQVVPQTPDTVMGRDGELIQYQVAKLFDLQEKEMSSYRNKLDTLIAYAKTKTNDHSAEGLKWALRNLDLRLGTPPMGEKRINYMHRFAQLELEGQRIKQQRDQFLGKELNGQE